MRPLLRRASIRAARLSWRVVAVLSLVLALPAAPAAEPAATIADAAETANAPDAGLLASPTTRDHIGRVVVPVTINGRGPFRFIVDTGASHSTVTPGLVAALGLKPSEVPAVLLDGITGSAEVSAVTIDSLRAGALSIRSTMMPVVWAPVMGGADGILGAAGLTNQTLTVDFERNRVEISDGVEPAMRSDSLRVHGVRLTDGLITLDAWVGRVRVRAVVDTGSERTLGNMALRNSMSIHRTGGVMVHVTSVYGATKDVEQGEVSEVPVIAIGPLRIVDVYMVYGNFHIFKVWGMEDKPAMILGMDVLGTVTSLGIDFKDQNVYLASFYTKGKQLFTPGASGAERTIR
jgi:predicted aspartyl protease